MNTAKSTSSGIVAPATALITASSMDGRSPQSNFRTVGAILDSLPFSEVDLRAPLMVPLPGPGLPKLKIPT